MAEDTAPLLVEIGCEELPAGAVAALAQGFGEKLKLRLKDARLAEEGGEAAWTPRRLLYRHAGVRLRQPENVEKVVGPPGRIAFGSDGSLTQQGLGFAAKNQVAPESVTRESTAKGEYAVLHKTNEGAAAEALLPAMLSEALAAVPLPRSMRWQDEVRFLRPIRWLLALHGARLIPFAYAGLKAAAESRGHRTLGHARFAVTDAAEFPRAWEDNGVVPSTLERRRRIEAAAAAMLPAGLRRRADAELEEVLANLTECPGVILGGFDAGYLQSLPEDVLVTVMRGHQKYFAVEDGAGKLAPHFLAVLNQPGDPQGLIRHGNERVLRARFSDAQFFFTTDRKRSLADRLPLLAQTTFQAKLGSYGAKALRLEALTGWLGEQWPGCNAALARQAALLAKCDLTTEMVKEFTELQGVMGGHYARAEGLPEPVAQAIADQYLYEVAPRGLEGAAVSVADKLDTIAGMFALGEVPSGSADPFALRRQANSLVRTLIERELPLSLQAGMEQARRGYGANPEFSSAGEDKAGRFFEERLSFYLREVRGASANQAAAVLASGSDHPLDAARRLAALQRAPELAAVAAVVKRARSIVRKEGGVEQWRARGVDVAQLREPAEQALSAAVAALAPDLDYGVELEAIAGLAAPLERFFNEVRVNDEDAALRANRLGLLAATVVRLNRIADFAELAVG
ncbi:MAG: glycine--tRNA ligase subunit beta [Terriglobales bacterium]